jgi:hypothetical protein
MAATMSRGWRLATNHYSQLMWAAGGDDEREDEADDEGFDADREPDEDGEPSLGSLEGHVSQIGWAMSDKTDREDEHDGCEPDHDNEYDYRDPRHSEAGSADAGPIDRLRPLQ